MAEEPSKEYKRLFWSSTMLIGNICTRENFTAKRVDNLFQTHGAEAAWRIKGSFPGMGASAAMIQAHNWMQGIAKYQPQLALPIARDTLAALSDSGSIVAYQDRQIASNLVRQLDALLDPQSSASETLAYHRLVLDAASSHFASGHFSSGVHRAFEALILAVQTKSERPDLDGRDLMFKAFNEDKPILRVSDDFEVQKSFKFLFAGAVGAIRNPQAHTPIEGLTAVEASEMLIVCSYLFRVLEKCTKVDPTNPTY